MSSMGRILMTVATAIYGLVPPMVDLGITHALHPDWTPHARLHMVWLVVTMSSVAALALYFIWWHSDRRFGVKAGGLLGLCVFGGFFVSAATAPLYGGSLHDKGGVPEVAGFIDANLLGFGVALALLLVGWRAAHRAA
mgnify:CR=1 FL=1